MPSAAQIVAQLTAIARDGVPVAVAWHVAIATALVTLALGWRPSRRLATLLLAAPLASVAAHALAYGNPFNGLVFTAAAVAVAVLARSQPATPVWSGPPWAVALGLAVIAFAWAYPHFLEDHSPIVYLVAAPVGLVPCPSLALVIGGSLLAGGLDRRTAFLFAALGLLYATIGAAVLGVVLDVGLAIGALALFATQMPVARARQAS